MRVSALVVSALVLVGMTGCSGSEDLGEPVAACTPPPTISAPSDIPADVPWPDAVALTKAQVKKKFVALEGFSQRSVEGLFEGVRPDITESGFDIINTDYEGFEAELYIAKGTGLAGIVSMREGPCDGYVKVNVIYDPLETAAGREAVRKTRKLSGEG